MQERGQKPRRAGATGVVRPEATRYLASGARQAGSGERLASRAAAERRLMRRVAARCGDEIAEACRYSSIPPAFLAALVANESGANPRAARFEPAVYRHLKALAEGRRARYGGIRREALEAEVADTLHPKAASFHEVYLTNGFRAAHTSELARQALLSQGAGGPVDEALRELATSWGLTQIMGYHLVGRAGTVRDLLEPGFHFKLALQLLAEFAERYQLDLTLEFAEMFRCWNTGRPYGRTTDARYVEKGLLRMELYRRLAEEEVGSKKSEL